MAEWEHRPCGTIFEARVPPETCDFCVGLMVRVTKFTEAGWRRVGPGSSRPKRKSGGSKSRASKRRRIYERDGWRCVECGFNGRKCPEKLTLDHRIPKSKGGSNSESNLQTMCRPCNQAKADDMPE